MRSVVGHRPEADGLCVRHTLVPNFVDFESRAADLVSFRVLSASPFLDLQFNNPAIHTSM
jgi:hypothetical protein